MNPLTAVLYSFLFGLLHGILPDEHTWPITFSYAIAGGSGKEGMKAGLYFSAAFTLQRAIVSELAWLALAPFLLDPAVNGIVYIAVGIAMTAAGVLVLRKGRYFHVHIFGHCHGEACEMERTGRVLAARHQDIPGEFMVPPTRWTLVHGFIAGFGFGGFSLFVNTVAAPAMTSAWSGFLPGLVFGLGSTIMLALVGGIFGAFLRWTRISEQEVRRIGSRTGGRTLFFGGLLFGVAGVAALAGLDRGLGFDAGYAVIAIFIAAVAIPAFVSSWREAMAARKQHERPL